MKNHDSARHLLEVKLDTVLYEGSDEIPKAIVLPEFKLEQEEFRLEPRGTEFFNYSLSVPEDARPGKYQFVLASKVTDSSAQKVTYSGVELSLAVGLKITLVVDNDAEKVTYVSVLDQISKMARDAVVIRFRYILTFGLLLVTIYFVFKAFGSKK